MSNLIDILFKFDYCGCLLLGYPLNIILIILIIFKTPKEMETHSRILIQNCVLDILLLTIQMFGQMICTIDGNGNPFFIFANGILTEFMKNNFNKIIYLSFLIILQFFFSINLYGLCAQFVFRYLILNRNMKINFRRYLLYLFSIVVLAGIFYVLVFVSFATFDGGFKQFDELNKTLPFISVKSKDIQYQLQHLL
uniref:Uncharacterized protein n=1 Tax=Meloidogyne enterolobii TaxID=390850 RepID=A0A6V7UPI6_MELEN|nr:unnamed protein product [Meloidogyne enterolobii]